MKTKSTKRKSSEHSTKPAKKSKPDFIDESSPFYELIQKAGFIFKDGEANQISKDQAVFQRDMKILIKRHPEYPEIVEEFTEGFSNHIGEMDRFFWSLMPTLTSARAEESSRGGSQDSLVRLLFGVDSLQMHLMRALLEKMAEFTGDEETYMHQNERVNLPRLIMHQFRWLDRINNSREIAEKMLEILCIVSLESQREIISCIPEIIDDTEHEMVAKDLKSMLHEKSELTTSILDSLSNLNLKSEILAQVRVTVVDSIPAVQVDELPVIIKFLLQTLTSSDAMEVIGELRLKLDFLSISRSKRSKESKKRSDSSEKGNQILIIEAINSGICFQKCVAEAWIKAVEGVKCSNDLKVIDVIVLLLLHRNGYKKPVESSLRNKIRAGHFTNALLQSTFKTPTQVLRDVFSPLLCLSEIFVRSPELAINHIGCAMYKLAFGSLDMYCQQEIVGNLVRHTSSGVETEVDSSLTVLEYLVENHGNQMASFVVFVKGILDYLEHLSVGQMRHLYSLLSSLAIRTSAREGSMQDEMHIIIRKQLTNNDQKYKRMGVIGAVMIVKSLAYYKEGNEDLSDNIYNQVIRLLQLVNSSCGRSPIASALFMDELASIVNSGVLHPKVVEWIAEHVSNDFQEDFVTDITPENMSGKAVLDYNAEYGLDEDDKGIVVNMMPIVANYKDAKQADKNAKVISPLCITPHLRLLQACERKQYDGNLEGIDALLGCPVYMPKSTLVDKIDSLSQLERNLLCENLFFSINWFREIINAFATQEDPEMKAKVISRMHHITELNKVLQQALAAIQDFQPPLANFELEETKAPSAGSAGPSGGKKGRKAGGKGQKKKDGDKENESFMSQDNSQLTADHSAIEKTQVEKSAYGKPVVNLAKYSPFLREIDMDVFCVLNISLVTKKGLDSQMHTEEETSVQIQPEQLLFLLDDMVRKLQRALPATASKRRSPFKAGAEKLCGFCHLDELGSDKVATKMLKLLPALCDHLEKCFAYFQTLIAANDGIMDAPGSHNEESLLMGQCLTLLLQALNSYFSWTGFQLHDNQDLLREGLLVLAGRLGAQGVTQYALEKAVKYAFSYLEKFSSTVPDLGNAVMLTKLLTVIQEKANVEGLKSKTSQICEEFLKQKWFNSEGQTDKGAKFNEQLQQLLKLYLGHTDDILTSLEEIATVGFKELLDVDKEESAPSYATLSRSTLPVFYRTVLNELSDNLKSFPCKPSDSDKNKMDVLLRWNIAVRIFHILVNMIKAFGSRNNISAIMKYGRLFVEFFVRLGMPLLDNMFRGHRDDVQSLLKNLQLSTRFLHHMCGHSKILRDVTLTNQVPFLKKALESFVYRVKAMLTVNRCHQAFWLGNLKNRDLQGEEIISQSMNEDSSSKDSDEEEALPDEDADSDVEVSNADDASTAKDDSDSDGYSETY